MKKRPPNIGAMSLFISAGAVIVASCLYIYLYETTSSLADSAVLAKGIVAAEKADLAQGKDVVSMYQSTSADRAKLSGYFVRSDDAVAFINAVESVGPESGATVSISSIGTGAAPATSSSTTVTGSLTASISSGGSWTEAMKALALLEALPYDISIDRLSLSASPGGGTAKEPTWLLSLSIIADTIAPASSTPSSP